MKQFQEQFAQAKENYLNRFEETERAGAARYFDIETAWMNSALVSDTKLRSCDPLSLRKCIANVVTAGLTLSPVMKFCYLIPRRINGQMESTLEISYMGLIKMMTDSGTVAKMEAHIIYRNDEYDIQYGARPIFEHRPVLENRGEMIAVYAVAHIRGVDPQVELLTKDDVLEIKKRSQASVGPWIDFEAEMWRKSAIKRLFKYLPKTEMSDQLIAALSIEHRNDTSLVTAEDIAPEVAAEIFEDTTAEVLEETPAAIPAKAKAPADKPKPKRKTKAERAAAKAAKEAAVTENKTDIAVNEEPAVEPSSEPVEVVNNVANERTESEVITDSQVILKIVDKTPEITSEAPQASSLVNGSLSDLMTKLT